MADLIDRQAAIDAVNEYLRISEVSKTVQNMTSIQAILKWLPSAEPRWIPCSERLPKDGQGVLVTVDDNEFDIKVGSCIYSDGVFFSALYDLDVIAWMPLPEPWKGEEDGRSN